MDMDCKVHMLIRLRRLYNPEELSGLQTWRIGRSRKDLHSTKRKVKIFFMIYGRNILTWFRAEIWSLLIHAKELLN